ncbi:hypothetical protein IWW36_000112 [Coemansia brasiliensis]|uniref:Magnesium transporter n=1 Tax=Coemansia brasiliensis TaxID=2650707 RepID=A0A9W8IBY4_9FUNG|nr:hypothetical protein IWW36_000112 [Coemansia brasiliensis]
MFSRLLLGVFASVTGSLGHSLGMTLQKRAHMRLQTPNSVLWRDRQWQLGLLLYLLSSTLPPIVALSILPVFVAAPLAAVGLVANAVFARYILHSTFAHTDALGTLLVTVGSGCVALFGAIDEPPLSLPELLLLYKRPAYVIFFNIYLLLVVVLIAAEIYWRRRYVQLAQLDNSSVTALAVAPNVPLNSVVGSRVNVFRENSETEPLLGAVESPAYSSEDQTDSSVYSEPVFAMAADGESMANMKSTRSEQMARYVSGFLSAVVSGLICSQTLLLAKSGIGLLVLTLRGNMQFKDPLALAIVIGLLVTALANLYFIQRALRLCSTLTVVPLCYCSSSLSALFSSLVYFDQIRLLTSTQIAMIAVGIGLLGAGVLLLSMKAESLPLISSSSGDEDNISN